MDAQRTVGIGLVGFDADDTLWRSQDYFDAAQADFERIVATYVDLDDVAHRLYAVEKRNLALFGYGVKGMVLSMVEAAVEITQARISASDVHRIVELGKGRRGRHRRVPRPEVLGGHLKPGDGSDVGVELVGGDRVPPARPLGREEVRILTAAATQGSEHRDYVGVFD